MDERESRRSRSPPDDRSEFLHWILTHQNDVLIALANTKLHPKILINDEVKVLAVKDKIVYYRRTFDMQALEFTHEKKQEGVPEHYRFRRAFRLPLADVFDNCCSHFDLQLSKIKSSEN